MSGVPFARAMTRGRHRHRDRRVRRGGRDGRAAGFDAVELHLGHGYLLSQFLCPATNRRATDGAAALTTGCGCRSRYVQRVRERVGAELSDPRPRPTCATASAAVFELEESIGVGAAAGSARVSTRSCSAAGFTSKTPFYLFRGARPLKEMIEVEHNPLQKLALRFFGSRVIREYPFKEMFFLDDARAVRRAVRVPLVLLGGVLSLDNLETAMREGFDFVAMGRALIADPDLINRMQRGAATRSRCISCNQCVAEMDRNGVRCVL